MPRKPRILKENFVYHVFNRRTDRQLLFPTSRAFDDFIHLMETGRGRFKVRICTYCLMETHWHQAIWIREDGASATSRYLRWLSSRHALRFRAVSNTRGYGHVYQDRYKSVEVETDAHYLTLMRYIEANPVVAGLVDRAELWPWSGFAERLSGRRRILDEGPIPLPHDWSHVVNTPSLCDDFEEP